MNNQDFGKFIVDLRKEKGITQIELAEKLNVSDKAISRWENGKNYPDIEILETLANELGVSISELIACKKINITENAELETAKVVFEEVGKKELFRTILKIIILVIVSVLIVYVSWFVYWGRRHLVLYDFDTVYLTETQDGIYNYEIDVKARNWLLNPFIHCFELYSNYDGEQSFDESGGTNGCVVVSGFKTTEFKLKGTITDGYYGETVEQCFKRLYFKPKESELKPFTLYMNDHTDVEYVYN